MGIKNFPGNTVSELFTLGITHVKIQKRQELKYFAPILLHLTPLCGYSIQKTVFCTDTKNPKGAKWAKNFC